VLLRALRLKQYHCVDFFASEEIRTEPSEHVYLIPNQFPFIFKVTRKQLQTELDLAVLDKTFRTLNTMRRIQVVRSVIPKKTVYTNLQSLKGESVGFGCLKVSMIDPLSGVELRQSSHQLNLILAKNNIYSSVDFEPAEPGSARQPPQAIRLSRCNIIDFSLTTQLEHKSRRVLLYHSDISKIKKTDLFYCIVKVRAGSSLKIYLSFARHSTNSQRLEPGTGQSTQWSLFIRKIVLKVEPKERQGLATEVGEGANNSPASLRPDRTAHQGDTSNYRFNILQHPVRDGQHRAAQPDQLLQTHRFAVHSEAVALGSSGAHTRNRAVRESSTFVQVCSTGNLGSFKTVASEQPVQRGPANLRSAAHGIHYPEYFDGYPALPQWLLGFTASEQRLPVKLAPNHHQEPPKPQQRIGTHLHGANIDSHCKANHPSMIQQESGSRLIAEHCSEAGNTDTNRLIKLSTGTLQACSLPQSERHTDGTTSRMHKPVGALPQEVHASAQQITQVDLLQTRQRQAQTRTLDSGQVHDAQSPQSGVPGERTIVPLLGQ
jgi:hypothetical protein